MSEPTSDAIQMVIDCLDDGALVIDSDGALQLWNSAALEMLRIEESPREWFARESAKSSSLARACTAECYTEVTDASARIGVMTRALKNQDGTSRGRISILRPLDRATTVKPSERQRELAAKLVHDINNLLFELLLVLDPAEQGTDAPEVPAVLAEAHNTVEMLRDRFKHLIQLWDDGTPDERAPRERRAPSRRGHILVLDDDPVIVTKIANALRGKHEVTTHTNPRDALREIARGIRFDVIICDLMMPSRTGMDLYSELTLIAPHQASRIVFITGFETGPVRAFLESVPNIHLAKPFRLAELLDVVDERLAAA